MRKRYIIIPAAIILVELLIIISRPVQVVAPSPAPDKTVSTPSLMVSGRTYELEVADTEEERIQGLSGRPALPAETVLLFTFEKADYWGIWMKDMKFPIDIIWLDKDYRVLDIVMNASPNSYPRIYKPHAPASFVLEANAGFAVENKIQPGAILKLTYQ